MVHQFRFIFCDLAFAIQVLVVIDMLTTDWRIQTKQLVHCPSLYNFVFVVANERLITRLSLSICCTVWHICSKLCLKDVALLNKANET